MKSLVYNTFLRAILCINLLQSAYGNLPPRFTSDLSPPIVREDAPIGTVVLTLAASDPEGSRVTYGLQGTSSLRVDQNSGAVTVIKPLDREDKDTLRLVVTVEDQVQGADNNVVRVPLELVVLDVNDVPPLFSRKSFEVEVAEDAAVGSTVLDGILLTDLDQIGEVLAVHCQEETKNPSTCEEFEVSAQQGTSRLFRGSLVLKKALSYDRKSTYSLSLVASDGENVVSVPLNVHVRDVQNTPPIFSGSTTGIVSEDAPIGSLVMTVRAEDGDRGDPRTVKYELVKNTQGFFLLDHDTGELRTAKPLDREAVPNHAGIVELSLLAYEVSGEARAFGSSSETSIQISVTIQDVNDEAPSFNKREYRVTIPENLPPGTPVPDLDMVVKDTDVGSNSVFAVRLADSSRFTIEPRAATGSSSLSLRVNRQKLDYENPNERTFILLVIAEETRTNPRLSSTATIHVSVTDINDNPPSFQQEAYTATVAETAPEGTVVTTIKAMDRDTGIFGVKGIRYSIFGNGAEKFRVEETTGVITVAECGSTPGDGNCLDFETRRTYFLSFEARDDEGRGHTSVVPLRISLKDVNDNPPRFTRQIYKAVIQEGAEDFDPPLVVKASDLDVTSKITYSIVGGDDPDDGLFVIDDQNGQIRVRDKNGLDMSNMERNDIILMVKASDGVASHSASVRVTVRDVNNNRPIFAKENYSASVQENIQVGTPIETVSASDADSGMNAEVFYRIMKGAFDDFEIDETSGLINVVRKLNFDARNFYSIEIVASDKGIPQLRSSMVLNITIIDNNDKNPYFVPTTQRIMVNENTSPGTAVHQLVAEDQDVTDERLLEFKLSSVSSSVNKKGALLDEIQRMTLMDLFSVSASGEVTLASTLNRNISIEMTLAVIVTDPTATPPQEARGFLVITVVDVNDHPPSFAAPWTLRNPYLEASVTEELPPGSVVTIVTASDIDSNIAGYEFSPPSDVLDIDKITGVVSVKGRLDFESRERVTETVIVRDTGVPQLSSTATLLINLININDEEPVFEEPRYEAEVEEHSPPGTRVLVVSATDEDKNHLGTVTYSLAGDHMQYFSVDSSGLISILPGADLDRETLPELRLRVVATDSGPEDTRRQTSVPVDIKILDINDHEPKFIQKDFSASVIENLPLSPPVPVLQAKALDEDEGINSALWYTISGGTGKDLFRLDPTTGILYPAKLLRTSGQQTKYTLDLRVTDMNGTGMAFDTARAEIVVLPQNEHKPTFVSPPHPKFKIQILENATEPETRVLKVEATDGDDGANGRMLYHLKVRDENVQETQEFKLDPETGVLSTKKILDREEKAQYELVLVAKDQGSPISYESLRVVTISLEDVDDNPPTFPTDGSNRRYSFSVLENRPENTLIGQVRANDVDFGKNARIFYYIVSGNVNSNFVVDKANGNLFTANPLDREERGSYTLIIKASNDPNFNVAVAVNADADEGDDGSFAYVDVVVKDVNDTPPTFSSNMFYAGVPHTAEVKRLVRLISARDDDAGRNGSVSYSIRSSIFYRPGESKPVGSIVPSPFNITEEGKLLTATLMAPYRRHRFLLEIQAREVAPPHRTDTCNVNIWVWERDKLIKIVFAQRPDQVVETQDEIAEEISAVLEGAAVVDEIRYFTFDNDSVSRDWTEMLIHVVNKTSHIVPTEEVLKKVDRAYASLVSSPVTSQIRKIDSAVLLDAESEVDARMAGLIALVIALFVGFISFIAVCCCLRYWVMTPAKSREHLIHRAIEEDIGLNTTENPLWMDQKLKTYEEQELTMQVMSEFDPAAANAAIVNGTPRHNVDVQSNTYATIQKSHGGTIRSMQLRSLQLQGAENIPIGDDPGEINDYATLDHLRRANNAAVATGKHGPRVPGVQTPLSAVFAQDRDTPEMKELVTSFTGSTFQPPADLSNMANRPLPDEPNPPPPHRLDPDDGIGRDRDRESPERIRNLMVNSLGEPCLVAELI